MNILFYLEKYGLLLPCMGAMIHKTDQSISTYFFEVMGSLKIWREL